MSRIIIIKAKSSSLIGSRHAVFFTKPEWSAKERKGARGALGVEKQNSPNAFFIFS